MLEVKGNNIKFPCHACIHKNVCSLLGKMEQTRVSLQDDRFSAIIECEEYVPVLENNVDGEEQA